MTVDTTVDTPWAGRFAAIAVTLATLVMLVDLGSGPPSVLYLRAAVVAIGLHAGLFWAPDARGLQRYLAALLMVPSTLIFAGMIGEAIQKLIHGYELNALATVTSCGGMAVYLWQFWSLARRKDVFLAMPDNAPRDDERLRSAVSGAVVEANVVELEVEPTPTLEVSVTAELNAATGVTAATEGLEPRDLSAMADPQNAHSPMSPDDEVSESHTGLHTQEHSTGGNTPAS